MRARNRRVLAKENINADNDNLVINVDFMGYGSNINNLKDVVTAGSNKKYRYIHANINSKEALDTIAQIADIDIIVNFAAETHVDRSISNPTAFVDSSLNGVISLLEFCRLHEIPSFVQVSTDEVYGDLEQGTHSNEESPLEPNSPYSASKASADLLTRAYNKTYGLNTVITRCSNNFGPNQFPEKLIPKAIISALKGLRIPLYGDGTQIRQWIYVNDHVNAILKVMLEGKSGEIYNISSSGEISNVEVVNKIRDILHNINANTEVQTKYVQDRPGHDRRYSLDCSKIKRELGWEQVYSFDHALEQTIK